MSYFNKQTTKPLNVTTTPASETSKPNKKYFLGDSIVADGKDCVVVETYAANPDSYHVKNKDAPFDSFVIDLGNKEVIETNSLVKED